MQQIDSVAVYQGSSTCKCLFTPLKQYVKSHNCGHCLKYDIVYHTVYQHIFTTKQAILMG